MREQIFKQIDDERAYQEGKWGTEFNDKNTLNDWSAYICQYLGNATTIKLEGQPDEQRRQILKVATLAVAALETFDRNNGFAPRHYEQKN